MGRKIIVQAQRRQRFVRRLRAWEVWDAACANRNRRTVEAILTEVDEAFGPGTHIYMLVQGSVWP